jgi:putative drug exporter of the RND superfamily
VMLGLLCLSFAETNSTRGLGPVAAIGVAVALLAMLTLLPALLAVFGRRMFWPFRPQYGSPEPTVTGPWARMGRRIARHPRPVWILTSLFLGVMALGVTTLQANGLSNAQAYRGHPDAVVGEQVLAAHFPAGVGSPVIVIADAAGAARARHILATTPGIASVTAPVVGHGEAYLQGTLAPPPDSAAATKVIEALRGEYQARPELGALVGGSTAVTLDVERAAAHDRDLIIPIVLLVVFLILALLLRALIAPLLLMATVVLSLLATLGLSSFVFTHVFGFGGEDAALPLYIFVFLVALGIDYNIFLMSRVREESKRSGTLFGAITALGATGGVITAAGFVLAGTFAVLSTLPLTTFTEVGFAVAFGVLLDTVVVRSVLVTALNLELGDRVWWPSALSRGPDAGLLAERPATVGTADNRDGSVVSPD